MAYSFDLLTEQKGAAFIQSTIEKHQDKLLDGWPCWSTGNHDVARVMTRWADKGDSCKQAGSVPTTQSIANEALLI